MSKSYKILKVRDKNDTYYTPIERLFDIPFKILINGKSQLSGKTTIILNLLLNPVFGYDKLFDGDDIHIISKVSMNDFISSSLEMEYNAPFGIFEKGALPMHCSN